MSDARPQAGGGPVPRLYPGGQAKALVLSFDDGPLQDRRLVALLNAHGLRGTFHINSGRFGQARYVTAGELRTLYAGHEISAHTVSHPHLELLDSDAVRREIADDCRALGRHGGRPVRGLSYPFGTYDRHVLELLPDLGICYARTVADTQAFDLPRNLLEWHPTCHQNEALHRGAEFLQRPAGPPALLCLWGHAWEFDADWGLAEAIARLLGRREDVWSATAAEFADWYAGRAPGAAS